MVAADRRILGRRCVCVCRKRALLRPPPTTLPPSPQAMKADEDVVLAAVGHGFQALNFAAPALKADKRVCLRAVQQNGRALQVSVAEEGGGGGGAPCPPSHPPQLLPKHANGRGRRGCSFCSLTPSSHPRSCLPTHRWLTTRTWQGRPSRSSRSCSNLRRSVSNETSPF